MVSPDDPDALSAVESRWRHRPTEPPEDRFAHVVPPPDHGQLARQVVARLRELLTGPDGANAELLSPFLDGVADLVEQAWPTGTNDDLSLGHALDDDEDGAADDDDEPLSSAEAAAALVAEVEQLEDLLEALRPMRRD